MYDEVAPCRRRPAASMILRFVFALTLARTVFDAVRCLPGIPLGTGSSIHVE